MLPRPFVWPPCGSISSRCIFKNANVAWFCKRYLFARQSLPSQEWHTQRVLVENRLALDCRGCLVLPFAFRTPFHIPEFPEDIVAYSRNWPAGPILNSSKPY